VSIERTFHLLISRDNGYQPFSVTVAENASVLDALEEAGRQDPTLIFRHSCHHASCGSCGMIINGTERLACATSLMKAAEECEPVRLRPLRNFRRVADLAVDPGDFLRQMQAVDRPLVARDESGISFQPLLAEPAQDFMRFEACIECGLCVSACPVAATSRNFLGPATLAAANRLIEEPRGRERKAILNEINNADGVWRCHDVHVCTEVCPAGVDPGAAIAALRWTIILHKQGDKHA
jgi:succinate dehydrogenase / fumarate reductase, iron-sulfur subunit